jgi:hypothetical protein
MTAFEGREELVSPTQLKVPWNQAGQCRAREDKFAAVETATSSSYDTPEYWAARSVLGQVPKELPDRDRLTKFIDADASLLGPAFVDNDGSYVAPWAVAERLALYIAPRLAAQLWRKSHATRTRTGTGLFMASATTLAPAPGTAGQRRARGSTASGSGCTTWRDSGAVKTLLRGTTRHGPSGTNL